MVSLPALSDISRGDPGRIAVPASKGGKFSGRVVWYLAKTEKNGRAPIKNDRAPITPRDMRLLEFEDDPHPSLDAIFTDRDGNAVRRYGFSAHHPHWFANRRVRIADGEDVANIYAGRVGIN